MNAPADAVLSIDGGIARSAKYVQAGDLVLLYLSPNAPPIPLTVTPGKEFINTYGAFPHDSMIGRPFGSQIESKARGGSGDQRTGFLHMLRPTPTLWTWALPHRTQILYLTDISFIISRLALSPGARIIEAGTGSGSMTHALAKTVSQASQWKKRWQGVAGMGSTTGRGGGGRGAERQGDRQQNGRNSRQDSESPAPSVVKADEVAETDASQVASTSSLTLDEAGGELRPDDGRVWSFEFHSERARKARLEFEAHGLTPSIVTLNHRNVCKAGFGLPEPLKADAIFLDLPAPWEAIPFAGDVLRRDVATRICAFSPCMEQVLKTVAALHTHGFSDVEMYEALSREHEVDPAATAPQKNIDEVVERIQRLERGKKRKRLDQMAKSEKLKAEKRKASEMEANGGPAAAPDTKDKEDADPEEMDAEPSADADADADQMKPNPDAPADDYREEQKQAPAESTRPPALIMRGARVRHGTIPLAPANVYSKPSSETRGHTSYLTFAMLQPRLAGTDADEAGPKTKLLADDGDLKVADATDREPAEAAA